MPLLPDSRSSYLTEELCIDGDIYRIITQISGFERDQLQQAAAVMEMPRKQVEANDPDAKVSVRNNTAEYNQLVKKIFIRSWSFPEPLTSANLRRMPVSHDDAVLERCRQILVDQRGAEKESPLALPSSS